MSDVSVVMPARNNAPTIEASLKSCLTDMAVREVIVVVHPSTDKTAGTAAATGDPRIRVIEDDGRGISRAMNVGLAAARGTYIAKIDADDLVPTGRFDRQAACLDAHGELMAICGRFSAIDDAGRLVRQFAADRAEGDVTAEYRAQERPTHFGAWLCRRRAWEEVGGFREWFVTAEDLDMPFRLAMQGTIWFRPEPAYLYRLRSGSITRIQADVLREFYERWAIDFARQRLATGSDDLDAGNPPPLPEAGAADARRTEFGARQKAGMLTGRAWQEFEDGKSWTALGTMSRSVAAAPFRQKPAQIRGFLTMGAKTVLGRRKRP